MNFGPFVVYRWRDPRSVTLVISSAVMSFLAMVQLGIGLVLMLPGDTFASSQVWRVHAEVGNEARWAWFYVVAGLIGYGAMLAPQRLGSVLGVAMLSSVNGATALMFLLSTGLVSPGILTYVLIAALGYTMLGLILRDALR